MFLSWPGQHDLEDCASAPAPGSVMDARGYFSPQTALASHLKPKKPRAQTEDMRHRSTTRQLGCAPPAVPCHGLRVRTQISFLNS